MKLSEMRAEDIVFATEVMWHRAMLKITGVRFNVKLQRDGWLVMRARADDFITPEIEAQVEAWLKAGGDQGGSPPGESQTDQAA